MFEKTSQREMFIFDKSTWKLISQQSLSAQAHILSSGLLSFLPILFLSSGGGNGGEGPAYSLRVVSRSPKGVWVMDAAGRAWTPWLHVAYTPLFLLTLGLESLAPPPSDNPTPKRLIFGNGFPGLTVVFGLCRGCLQLILEASFCASL